MLSLCKMIFGTAQSRTIKRYRKQVERINQCEESYQALSDKELRAKTAAFKTRLQEGESTDDLLIEAYAVIKNVCRRLVGSQVRVSGYKQKWDMVPFDVQLIGAIAMHNGSIAEMQTGEGKTLTAAMPLYLHALTGNPVHLVTVNDYLAKRDCEWIGAIFRWLGLKVSAITNDTPPHERRSCYECDIVYGTASEFGFDYLRDNSMAQGPEMLSQRGHYFAIVDEVDSILIDEARTPLIISGPAAESKQMYDELQHPVSQLVRLQRDLCNGWAAEVRTTLENYDLFQEHETPPKLSKEAKAEVQEALKKLWLITKGFPTNKMVRRVRENPDLRARLEQVENYFYSETNKDERIESLSTLYIIVDEKNNDYELTDQGMQNWKGDKDTFEMLDLGEAYGQIEHDEALSEKERLEKKVALQEEDSRRKEHAHNVRQLFRAYLIMERDIDYIVQNGKIVIIDEHTGRPQPGRRFSDGLHQSIEAKEHVPIQQETQTYATVTLQNYFRMYDRLAGMTGTAITEAQELKEIYKLDVLEVPTHRTCIRNDESDQIYMTEREKYNAILAYVQEVHATGRPILMGTESVEVSEKLSRILKKHKIDHNILNAKQHDKEAEVIALAGAKGAITIATNMAGRGTDIKLGEGVPELGGLCVIGTSRHTSRRIDRQLRGRSGRQGDKGSSIFYVSFEDPLMKCFSSGRLTAALQRFRPPEGEAISAKILDRSIERAQKQIEQKNYTIRKHTLQYDDVINKHRQEVYKFRHQILTTSDPCSFAMDVLTNNCEILCENHLVHTGSKAPPETAALKEAVLHHFPIMLDEVITEGASKEAIETALQKTVISAFQKKLRSEALIISVVQKATQQPIEPIGFIANIIRNVMIKAIDKHWQKHLLGIDHLRTEVGLHAIAQKDPLIEFKQSAFHLFRAFSENVKGEMSKLLFAFNIMLPNRPEIQQAISQMQIMGPPADLIETSKNWPDLFKAPVLIEDTNQLG